MSDTRYTATYHREGRYWVIDVSGFDWERGHFHVGTTQTRVLLHRRVWGIRPMAVDLVEVMCGEKAPDVLVVKA